MTNENREVIMSGCIVLFLFLVAIFIVFSQEKVCSNCTYDEILKDVISKVVGVVIETIIITIGSLSMIAILINITLVHLCKQRKQLNDYS